MLPAPELEVGVEAQMRQPYKEVADDVARVEEQTKPVPPKQGPRNRRRMSGGADFLAHRSLEAARISTLSREPAPSVRRQALVRGGTGAKRAGCLPSTTQTSVIVQV